MAASAAALVVASPASAAVIVKNISITASNFSLAFGSATPAPFATATLNFTVSFDNSADVNTTTTGFTVNSFNMPYPLAFAYSKSIDTLIVATSGNVAGCNNPANSFCTFISGASTATPTAYLLQQVTAGGGVWRAQTIAMGGAVPEPATWAMMIGGFGAVGGAMRYRRRKATISFA